MMNDTPNLAAFLKVINQPSWEWTIVPDREVWIDCPDYDTARAFLHNWYDSIKVFTLNFNCDRAWIRYPNCQKPFDLDFRTLDEEARRDKRRSIHLGLIMTPQTPNLTRFQTNIPGLGETIFPDFLQFLAEETRKGRFWVISEWPNERILFVTDNAEPGRLSLPAHRHIGLDRLDAWRDSLEDYNRLQHLLVTEKSAPSFEYNRYRLDNSFVHFQKTHYLVEGLFGTQCRASVSEGWELLKPAPDTN